jgi:hypothetical protein
VNGSSLRGDAAVDKDGATMTDDTPGKAALWTGRIISGLIVALLTMSAVMKLKGGPDVEAGAAHLGLTLAATTAIGVEELISTILYAIPQTAVLGAILLTGHMSGAVALHVQLGEPWFVQVLIGVFAWAGLWLREPRLRRLLPLRR